MCLSPRLKAICVQQGMELFVFERYMTFRKSGGNHCQMNVLPVATAAAADARATLQRLAAQHGLSLQSLEGPAKVGLPQLMPCHNGRRDRQKKQLIDAYKSLLGLKSWRHALNV